MTDNEIIKALECCCGDDGCFGCPYTENHSCRLLRNPIKDALDLINRQKAEIDEYYEIKESWKTDKPHLIKVARAEAIKGFAARFKQEINLPLAVMKVFDNLVKEMVGEDKVQWSRQGECPITAEQFNAIYDDEEMVGVV
jgi:hypothetical protein